MPPLQPFTGSSGDRAGFLLGAGNLAFVRRDEIESLYAAGVDVVVGVIAAQAERIAVLEGEIEELKRLIGRSSNNSSLAPSRDSPQARGQRSGKKRSSGKKQAGSSAVPGRQGRRFAARCARPGEITRGRGSETPRTGPDQLPTVGRVGCAPATSRESPAGWGHRDPDSHLRSCPESPFCLL